MKMIFLKLVAIALAASVTPVVAQQANTAQTKEAELKAYVDMIRKDVKKDKVAIVTEAMELTPDQASKFWPVYNEYDKALTALADERLGLIRTYAENFNKMSDPVATKIANGVLDLDAKRIQLKRQYLQRMSQTLSPILAARFLQVENQLEKIIDLQISTGLPLFQ